MEKTIQFIKHPIVTGTWLVWLTILVSALLAAVVLFFYEKGFISNIDLRVLVGFSPVALVGEVRLLKVVWPSRSSWGFIYWYITIGFAANLLSFILEIFAYVAASELGNWVWPIILCSIVLYYLGLALSGVGGFFLLRDFFRDHVTLE